MDRQQTLLNWVQHTLKDPECYIKPASSDASFRSYWRVFSQARTFIVMDAPPIHENCEPFIDISMRLSKSDLNVPEVFHKDLQQGFLLLSDLGTVQYLDVLNDKSCKALYGDAITALIKMQKYTDQHNLAHYNEQLLQQEMNLFDQWFINKHIGIELNQQQQNTLSNCHQLLIINATEQPQTFVHRDYHSRNLMKTAKNNPGILDFQDAVIGPVTYDLVSLLRDCYIKWDNQIVEQLSDLFLQQYNHINQQHISNEKWNRWFDLMGMQRHLKAIGIFCRLNYRDNKPNYLKDINRTLSYVKQICTKYTELQNFLKLIDDIQPNMECLCEP